VSSHDELVSRIAENIERYLTQRPEAADTAEGISTWWLPSALGADALPAVLEALRQLEARGIVARMERSGGTSIYSSALRRGGSKP
jgi:Fe2+ or Zn2+ uptake regulation protein